MKEMRDKMPEEMMMQLGTYSDCWVKMASY